MASTKGSTCCCCDCQLSCINIGSLVPDCEACGEKPVEFTVGGFCGPTIDNLPHFYCCPGFVTNAHLLIGTAGSCSYTSLVYACDNGVQLEWEMVLSGLAGSSCVGEEVVLTGTDGFRAVWELPPEPRPWDRGILCTRIYVLDEAGVVNGSVMTKLGCTLPRYLCVSPVTPCCSSRATGLPRSLTLTKTGNANCACSTGTFSLTWNPLTDKWEGTGAFCSTEITVKVWCQRLVGGGTSWFGTMDFPAGCNGPNSLDISFTLTQCDPVHLRWTLSTPGCCGSTMGNTTFDVTE